MPRRSFGNPLERHTGSLPRSVGVGSPWVKTHPSEEVRNEAYRIRGRCGSPVAGTQLHAQQGNQKQDSTKKKPAAAATTVKPAGAPAAVKPAATPADTTKPKKKRASTHKAAVKDTTKAASTAAAAPKKKSAPAAKKDTTAKKP